MSMMRNQNIVLVVDDDPGMLRGVKRLLREHGYDSILFPSAEAFQNHDDFEDLHLLIQATHGRHTGIVAIRLDNDPSRDMRDADIVRAIRNLEQSAAPMANEFHILNHWR